VDAKDTTKVESLTWNPPVILDVRSKIGGRDLDYILRGKVPTNASAFTIDFLSYTFQNVNLTLYNSDCFIKDKGNISK
jgi:hypothetical protein